MVNLEGMTMKELREIARSYGISYISERRKADLVRLIHQADKWRHYVVARGQAWWAISSTARPYWRTPRSRAASA